MIAGAFVALVATLLMNYGSFLQKVALQRLPRLGAGNPVETAKAFFRSKTWLQGQGVQLGGALFDNAAVGLAALSVVQPITAAGVALLIVLAVVKLKEKASVTDWISIVLILVGIVLLGVSLTSITGGDASPNMLLTGFFLIVGLVASAGCLYIAFRNGFHRSSALLGVGVGVLIGLTAVIQKLAWRDIGARWGELKMVSIFYSRFFWIGIGLALLTLFLFQVALQRSEALVIVPLVTGLSNVVPIIVGLLAFHEALPEGSLLVTFRFVSMLLIILGAVLLSFHEERPEEHAVHQAAGAPTPDGEGVERGTNRPHEGAPALAPVAREWAAGPTLGADM